MNNDVTVVITSCNRHHLLKQTLLSFLKFNTYKNIEKIIIYEDSEYSPSFLSEVSSSSIPIEVITTGKRVGQIKAIDSAYSHVTTQYIFHCEDDWEFYASGFIEASKNILENYDNIYIVQLRTDIIGHHRVIIPEETQDFAYCLNNGYHGWFTFNPGLRRLEDYKKIGSYSKALKNPMYKKYKFHFEEYLGLIYTTKFQYITVFLLLNNQEGFVRHLGEQDHIHYHHRSFDRISKKLKRYIMIKFIDKNYTK